MSSSPGRGHRSGVPRALVGRHSWICGLEPANINQLSSHLDQSRDRTLIVQHDHHVTLASAEHSFRAVLGEFALQEDVLKMVVARILVQGGDGRESARGALGRRAAGRGQEQ